MKCSKKFCAGWAVKVTMIVGMSLMAAGCHSNGAIEDILSSSSENASQDHVTEAGDETASGNAQGTEGEAISAVGNDIQGYLYMGTMYQEEGITTGSELIYWMEWDGSSPEIICQDPTCAHIPYNSKYNPDPTCSAAVINSAVLNVGSMVYGDNRLIFEYSTDTTAYNEEGSPKTVEYRTDIYICAMDGSNRKKAASIDGSINFSSGIICDDILYFSNFRKQTQIAEEEFVDEDGIPGTAYSTVRTYQLCGLNLSDLTCSIYAEVEGDMFFDFSVTEDYVYCVNDSNEEYVLYRVDRHTGVCEEVYRSAEIFYLNGAAEHYLLFSTWDVKEGYFFFYLYDEQTGEVQELLKSTSNDSCAVGDGFAIMTERVKDTRDDDTKDYDVAYALYSADGTLGEELYFKDNIQFWFLLGKRLIYHITPVEDSESEDSKRKMGFYAVDLEDIGQLEEQGRYINGDGF